LDFRDLNATNSKGKTPLYTILAIFRVSSIIWKVFGIFPKTLKNGEKFGGVGVGGKGVWGSAREVHCNFSSEEDVSSLSMEDIGGAMQL
jgi:hypothetical protein